jgi:DNA-binding MarR family transcriptional regulator
MGYLSKDHELKLMAEIFALSFFVTQRWTREAERHLSRFGLSAKQWMLLLVLAKAFPAKAPLLSEAAKVYGTSRQNVKKIAEQLEAKGFARLEPDPRDARGTRIALLDKAGELDAPDARAEQDEIIRSLFAGLIAQGGGIAELEVLARALRLISGYDKQGDA